MKHLNRIAALMTAAAIFAFLPGAQVCGQSSRRGGGVSSGHSSSMGSSHSGGSSYNHSSSHSGGSSYSRGSSHSGGISQSRQSIGSVSGRDRQSGSSVSGRQYQSRPSAGSISGSERQSRPSAGSISGRERPSSSASGRSGSVSRTRPERRGGYSDGAYSSGRRSTGSDIRDRAAAVPQGRSEARPSDHSRTDGARRAGGVHTDGARRGSTDRAVTRGHNRPAPGSRPYADGAYGRGRTHALPSRVHVSGRPGAPARRHHEPARLHERPHGFHHHGHHYYGHYLPAPPHGYVVRHYWGRDYYFYNDIWYRYHSGRYWVCRPPWGYVFTPLADAIYTACAFSYYYDRIRYYDTVNENARTIVSQNETIAANNAIIASQNETIARNAAIAQAAGDLANSLGLVQSFADAKVEYYYNDGVFYIKGADGQYTVIVPPAGALVETLPDDYEIVELGGETYYKVDDTIYRTTIVDGKALFEVLGQMTD